MRRDQLKYGVIRKVIPSLPVVARTPAGRLLDVADELVKLGHPEWRDLPPASLRLRIGTGDRILRNHAAFVNAGEDLVKELTEHDCLHPNSQIVELGCGCGRNAIALRRFLGPEGSYVGQDVDPEMIRWSM